MKRNYLLFIAIVIYSSACAQKRTINPIKTEYSAHINRPKLVIGLVVDQMRWDYLYRYYDRYTSGGLKRLINEGFSVENTFIPYVPTYTACGHSSIYTGSVPALNGIIGNEWYDQQLGRDIYCTEDSSVKTVGSTSNAGEMSPKNLLTTTITDELRLATNFKSKVIGIALKDRGSILPAGHAANGAYWYDGQTGNWITSTYYRKELPVWMQDYNKTNPTIKYYAKDWNTLYPISSYTQSTSDDKPYEGKFNHEQTSSFPHLIKNSKNYGLIRSTPYGNTMTLEVAKLAISSENLGKGSSTDFLAVSCSSTDYVGHQFGPNSIEIEDTYLRLDKDLADFLNYLDKTIGKGNYLFFLTADHGAAHVPGFLQENKLPGGVIDDQQLLKDLNSSIEKEFNVAKSVTTVTNNQVVFNKLALSEKKADFDKVKAFTVNYLRQQNGFADAVDLTKVSAATLTENVKRSIINGYNPRRSGDLYFILQPNWFDGGNTGTTHGALYPYDTHIPLVFMGWNVKPGKTNKEHYMTDIAATLAAMLHIQVPSGSIGEPITELTHQ